MKIGWSSGIRGLGGEKWTPKRATEVGEEWERWGRGIGEGGGGEEVTQ